MKALLQTILMAAPFLLPLGSHASGSVDISGETSDGWRVVIEEVHSTSEPYRYMYNVIIRKNGEGSQSYKDEPFEFGKFLDKKSGQFVHTLVCPENCKSPLAGTKYEIRAFKGSCENGDPEYVYVCVSGCKKSQRVPHKLTSNYWEC